MGGRLRSPAIGVLVTLRSLCPPPQTCRLHPRGGTRGQAGSPHSPCLPRSPPGQSRAWGILLSRQRCYPQGCPHECPTSGGHRSWRCCPLRQALGRPPIGLIWGASPISSSTIRLMRRALFATGLLLVAILTACSQDGCAAPRAELKILMQAWEDKIVGGDMPGAIIAQAKVEDLMRGDYWVCFQS